MTRILGLVIIALLALTGSASANTQQWSEPDETVTESGGKELDLQSIAISQNATEALFEAEIQYPVLGGSAPHDQVQVFLDTNLDGNAERAVGFVGLSSGSYTVEVRQVTTTPANCQRLGDLLYSSSPTSLPSPDGAGNRLLQAPFAASHLGASSYKWAAYAVNDSLSQAAFDYLPNDANPVPAKPNPLPRDYDGCDTDGDGTPEFSTIVDKAFPVDMTKGHQYGATTAEPGGGTGGGGGGGSTPPGPGPTRLTIGEPIFGYTPVAIPTMPRLVPTDGKSTDFITVTEAEKRLRALKVPVSVKLTARKSADAETTKQAKFLRSKAKGDEVMFQKPAPGTPVALGADGKPPVVKLSYYDAADDIRDRNKNCDLKSTALAKKALRGKSQSDAEFELRRLDCTATWTEAPAFGIEQPEVTSARKLGNGSIEVTIGLPRTAQDLLLIVKEDPFRTKRNELSFTEDWRLVKSGAKNRSRITVQVIERATGRFVPGALVAISDGDEEVATDTSDRSGEAELLIPFGEAGRRTLYAVYNGANGVTASGWRHVFVADLKGKSFKTVSGREMKASKGVYLATAKSATAAKRYRIGPATAGAGATGTQLAAPTIVQTPTLTFFRDDRSPTKLAPTTAPHGALDIPKNGSVLVCTTRGLVLAVNGVGGSASEACARTVLAIRNAALADVATVRSELRAPAGEAVQKDAQAAEQAGVQAPATPAGSEVGLISIAAGHEARGKGGSVQLPEQIVRIVRNGQVVYEGPASSLIGQAGGNLVAGGKVISNDGAGVISADGASLISDKGLGLISDNGGGLVNSNASGWISNNNGNFVSTNSGTFVQNSVGLVPGGMFGPLPMHGGAVISTGGLN
jgi:hypothetical protein